MKIKRDIDIIFTINKIKVPLVGFNINIDYNKIVQEAEFEIPFVNFILEWLKPFQFVELSIVLNYKNGEKITFWRGWITDVEVVEIKQNKSVKIKSVDLLGYFYRQTIMTIENGVTSFTSIKELLETITKQLPVDEKPTIIAPQIQLEGFSLDSPNLIENLEKYVDRTFNKIYYQPQTNTIWVKPLIDFEQGWGRVIQLSDKDIIQLSYNLFSQQYTRVLVVPITEFEAKAQLVIDVLAEELNGVGKTYIKYVGHTISELDMIKIGVDELKELGRKNKVTIDVRFDETFLTLNLGDIAEIVGSEVIKRKLPITSYSISFDVNRGFQVQLVCESSTFTLVGETAAEDIYLYYPQFLKEWEWKEDLNDLVEWD